jgi:hypothetical protein
MARAGISEIWFRIAMVEWVKKRAGNVHREDKYSVMRAQKERFIESHSQECFEALTDLVAKSVAALNDEITDRRRQISGFERGLNRFVLERKFDPAVRVECRLDYAGHNVRYRISRRFGSSKVFQNESTLDFDVSGKKEIMLRTFDAVPMSLQQVTQLLLEPFFNS